MQAGRSDCSPTDQIAKTQKASLKPPDYCQMTFGWQEIDAQKGFIPS
jgi:hypothetical protein